MGGPCRTGLNRVGCNQIHINSIPIHSLHTDEMRCHSVTHVNRVSHNHIHFTPIYTECKVQACAQTVRQYDAMTIRFIFLLKTVYFELCLPILPSRRCNTVRCTVRCQAGTASVISASERPLHPNTSHFHLQHTPLMC
jgi:hypothetical protein